MSVSGGLAAIALLGLVAFTVVTMLWTWRDMRERDRPPWLRVVVLVTSFIGPIGFVWWLLDLRKHPHRAGLSRRDIALQRFGHP